MPHRRPSSRSGIAMILWTLLPPTQHCPIDFRATYALHPRTGADYSRLCRALLLFSMVWQMSTSIKAATRTQGCAGVLDCVIGPPSFLKLVHHGSFCITNSPADFSDHSIISVSVTLPEPAANSAHLDSLLYFGAETLLCATIPISSHSAMNCVTTSLHHQYHVTLRSCFLPEWSIISCAFLLVCFLRGNS